MNNLFKKSKLYIFFIGIVFLITITLSLFNVFGISKNITNIIIMISMIIMFVIMGYLKGKNSNKKGYLQGLLIGFSLILILALINLISLSINWKSFIYYGILILSSIFGAMLGINKKK